MRSRDSFLINLKTLEWQGKQWFYKNKEQKETNTKTQNQHKQNKPQKTQKTTLDQSNKQTHRLNKNKTRKHNEKQT